jgi:hypothetical protein
MLDICSAFSKNISAGIPMMSYSLKFETCDSNDMTVYG